MTKLRTLVSTVAASLPCAASAVYLNPDGLGQALIFPYYTVQSLPQSAANNPYNTYLSVVNHTAQAKALRVRVRESRNSREVASFNLYLSPNDVWTGAVVPGVNAADAPRLITADRSCTLPAMTATVEDPPGVTFQNTFYTGSFNDSNGAGLDRTREGWVEMIEMASLTGALGTAVTQSIGGIPANCGAVQSPSAGDIAPPTGGLSGTLTVINVAMGMDFTVNAEALADLGTRPFYRPPADPYPDFDAVEIDRVSAVVENGFLYRSTWNRAADAVSAVLMRSSAESEYVLDSATASLSSMALTFPTRHFYANATSAAAPFSRPATWSSLCTAGGELVAHDYFDREEQSALTPVDGIRPEPPPPPPPAICAAALTLDADNGARQMLTGRRGLLGSRESFSRGFVLVQQPFQNGWVRMTQPTPGRLTSLGTSSRTNIATGVTTAGAHVYSGLPMLGFGVRTFVNGTLACSAGACQGNYGGAFPLKFGRSIAPAN
jgi:hypothetical protein